MQSEQVKERAAEPELSQQTMFQPPRKKSKKKLVLLVLLVIAAVIFFLMRSLVGMGQELLSATYLTEGAQMRDITVAVSSTGTVTPIDSYKVSALVTGEVLDAPFEEGDWVEKGQILYQIEAEDAQIAVEQAELGIRQAQLSLKNAQESVQPTANGSGTVQKLYVNQGDMVSAGSPIAEIADTTTMTLEVMFHAADAQTLVVGQNVTVMVDGTMETLNGTVETVAASDQVGVGGTLLRQVKVRVQNPGALTANTQATVSTGEIDCAAGGSFAPAYQQTVTATSTGEVTELYVSIGTPVNAGTVLLTIGGTAAENTLENAAIALENAHLSYRRAMEAMENYTITAPISGTVIEKNFKTGDTIESASLTAAGGNLAVIYDMSVLNFEMNIDELDINKIQVAQEVEITSDAVEGAVFTGRVDKLSISGATVSGHTTYPITVHILEPGALKPGMNVSADVLIERVEQVLSVPVEAVKRGAEKPYVLVAPPEVLDETGHVMDPSKLERREVELGSNDDYYIQIKAGLEEGEIVVWENQVNIPFVGMMDMA